VHLESSFNHQFLLVSISYYKCSTGCEGQRSYMLAIYMSFLSFFVVLLSCESVIHTKKTFLSTTKACCTMPMSCILCLSMLILRAGKMFVELLPGYGYTASHTSSLTTIFVFETTYINFQLASIHHEDLKVSSRPSRQRPYSNILYDYTRLVSSHQTRPS